MVSATMSKRSLLLEHPVEIIKRSLLLEHPVEIIKRSQLKCETHSRC